MHLAALAAFFVKPDLTCILLCVGLFLIRKFGITGGYHRYFSHRSFKTSRWFQFVLAFLGGMAYWQSAVPLRPWRAPGDGRVPVTQRLPPRRERRRWRQCSPTGRNSSRKPERITPGADLGRMTPRSQERPGACYSQRQSPAGQMTTNARPMRSA